jgi:D-lactate dehydrogenase
MRVAVFSAKPYDERFLDEANDHHDLEYFEARLGPRTAPLADGFAAVCVFVNDVVDAEVLNTLAEGGTGLVATRSAGFNHVDLAAADRLGITVARVPAYSPDAVAEHTVALILTLDRKIHRAHNRVREGNFALEGLLGFDLGRRTVGLVGTGRIGSRTAAILTGFGCRLLGYDPFPSAEAIGVRYVALEELLAESDIISLHLPLTPQTQHLIDATALATMRPGAMLINTSRGALVDTAAAVEALKSGHLGYLGLDVYEEEGDLFFEDLSNQVITDDVFSRLLTFPNVVVTGHQAFFTEEALRAIADATIANIDAFAAGEASGNEISAAEVMG